MGLTLLALLPGVLIVIYIFRVDKMEREPVSLLIKLIILGAVSCIPAGLLETGMAMVLPEYKEGTFMNAVITAFLIAGLIEELCKFFFLKIGSWKNIAFNCTFDGVVYGVSAAIGFACLENVMYVLDGGLETALMRAVLSVPLHAFCGAFMGAFYGRAKKAQMEGKKGKARSLQIYGIIVAIIIHGTYDTLAMWDSDAAFVLLLAFAVVLYIIGLITINALQKDDEWIIGGPGQVEFVQSYATPDMQPVKTTNGMSIAGLVCGIISFLSMTIFVLPGLLALIFGCIGNSLNTGEGKDKCAIAAIVMGILSLLFDVYLFIGMN